MYVAKWPHSNHLHCPWALADFSLSIPSEHLCNYYRYSSLQWPCDCAPPQRLTLTLAHSGAPAISHSYWPWRHALCASEGSRLSFDLTSLINLGRVIELLICSYFGCYRIKMCKVGRLKGVTSTHNFRNRRTTSSPAWGWQSREGMLKEETLGHGAEQPLWTLPSLCPVDSSQRLRLRLCSGHHDTVHLFRHPDPRNLLLDSGER